jgi:hypothetical protein
VISVTLRSLHPLIVFSGCVLVVAVLQRDHLSHLLPLLSFRIGATDVA